MIEVSSMERVYQCLRCGLTFRTKKQLIRHLVNTEKVNPLSIDYYYQSFSVSLKDVNKII
ncbi:hypothetical protein AFV1_ORF59a [Captovirus AFV1]|uniref:Putative zinc finger protein ORF59a n=1 Tax=Acidianus filamentous virus 1 (isolate United States/Yellowstone) TaxID=654909 RepID=Y059A_AFV1Y|nr:hypothetical protein AFV1_ORF59a [Captovirus AFV1]Q70LE5.1 RecName: Full=Putative zinc finger protein ORF59a [Acidianus filamentous virus 1 (isolate Yellowstone)]2LVH_A Chain A, Putative zinc finger protein ORF59a [Acidianus filamentous virus 1 (isolate Yellowstone)]CAD98935.1 hypothetical protein [Captovirus AFV1]